MPITWGAVRRRADDERGAVLVEFAIVAMVYFLFIFGTMDFGRMIFDFNIVSTAARDGVRWASVRGASSDHPQVGGATQADVQAYVISRSLGLLTAPDVTVTWIPTNDPGAIVQVQTQYNFTSVVPFLPQSVTNLQSTTTMTISR